MYAICQTQFAKKGFCWQKVRAQMLMKSIPVVNFTNILCAAFAPTVLRQKSTNLNRKHKKAARKTYVCKSCM
jgi:hypothetical protein